MASRNNPHTTPVKPIIEPTERSIPAVMITKVIPTAIIPIKEKFLVILKKLSLLEKASSTKNIIKQIMNKATVTQKDCSDNNF